MRLAFGRSRVQILMPTNLTGDFSWFSSIIKANAGLDFHYHDTFDHYSSNSYIIKLADAPCFATVNLYLLRKVKALIVSLLLKYYVNSGQLLNYVYIDVYLLATSSAWNVCF